MAPPRHPSGRGRERIVLAGGLASSLALVSAAFSSYADPTAAGEAALARLAGEVTTGIVAEWERLSLSDELFEQGAVRWDAATLAREPVAARDLLLEREEGHVAFDALFAEATRLELAEDDFGAALGAVTDALEQTHDEGRRAEARLRAIQLAAKGGATQTVRKHWRLASTELSGDEARGDVAYLLLCGLAAMEHLAETERAPAYARLARLWAGERLALPDDAALRGTLRRRLASFAPAGDTRLAQAAERHRVRGLDAFLGGLPAAPDGPLGARFGDGWVFAYRLAGAPGGTALEGRLLDRAELERRLLEAVRENELLPAGFAVDFTGGDDSGGEVVRGRTTLLGELGFVLRHTDPQSIVEEEGERIFGLRIAIVVLALFTAAASLAIHAALRRERRLAELKSSFIANVSHELRTPLSAILLMAENLESGRVDDPAARARYHRLIRSEAQRLRRLVDDVLDFSRLDRGEPPRLLLDDVDLAAFAEGLADEARERIESGGGTLVFHVPDFRANGAPGRARFDAEAIRRAAMNLVDNALKHSGKSAIEMGLDRAEDGAPELVLSVRDAGRGVPAARREEVFLPFTRLAEGDDAAPGAGLGLAIVRDIAEAHGGSARVRDPDAGPGAVFEIRIPIDETTT
ncbi:MAG: HAMP domain-containing sensor histidine kinase [Planctomycetota bacterium]|nr:HAMP domain-containing sensor histidine kinase [Planctomycetota bacterium]